MSDTENGPQESLGAGDEQHDGDGDAAPAARPAFDDDIVRARSLRPGPQSTQEGVQAGLTRLHRDSLTLCISLHSSAATLISRTSKSRTTVRTAPEARAKLSEPPEEQG